MVNRYLKKDKWMDAYGCGWCNVTKPEDAGETWWMEYSNGHEHDGFPGEDTTPTPSTLNVKFNASYNSATFDKAGLQVFIAACTEALEMIIDHENDPQYPVLVTPACLKNLNNDPEVQREQERDRQVELDGDYPI
jgi:hypothetical protein